MEKIKNKLNDLKLGDYYRKSSSDGEKQVASIPSQIEDAEKFRTENKLPVAKKVFKEERSAKFAGKRSGFTELVSMIEFGQINAILCWHLNRLARNMREGGVLIDLLSEGKLVIITTNGDVYDESSDMGVVAQLFGASKQYSIALSRDVKRGQRTKGKSGLNSGLAPLGFLNSKQGEKGERWWNVDEERFWKVQKLFELFLTKRYSVGKLYIYARDELKLTTPSRKKLGGKPVTRANIYKILKNPIYAGFFFIQGEKYYLRKGLPTALTEDELCVVQTILTNRCKPKVQKHQGIYSGFIKSPTGEFIGQDFKFQVKCDCKLKFCYRSKSHCPRCKVKIDDMKNPKYEHREYYYNVKKKKTGVDYVSLPETDVTNLFMNFLETDFSIPSPLIEWSKKYIHEIKDKEVSENLNVEIDKQNRIMEFERKKKRLREMLRDMKISDKEYDEDLVSLNKSYSDLNDNNLERVDWTKELENILDLTSNIKNIFTTGSFDAKRKILTKLGSHFLWDDEKLLIINRKSINTLIEGIKIISPYFNKFSPDKTVDIQGLNPDFEQVCISMRKL